MGGLGSGRTREVEDTSDRVCPCGQAGERYRLEDGTVRRRLHCARCRMRVRRGLPVGPVLAPAHWQHALWREATVCQRCGFVPEDPCQLQLDHIVPKWQGGTHCRENAQILCANCHAVKTAREARERVAAGGWWGPARIFHGNGASA